jgi:hypothetical protein
MHGPPLIGWLLVLLGTATGGVCLLRAGGRGASGDEGLMGIGMAVMAVPEPVLGLLPWGPVALAVLFGAAAVRALCQAGAAGPGWSAHHAHHAVGAAAMAYMAAAMVLGGMPVGHAGHGPGSGVPLLTGLLLAYFAVYALAAGLRLVPLTVPVSTVPGPPKATTLRAPELVAACRVSMAIGMLTMLLTL